MTVEYTGPGARSHRGDMVTGGDHATDRWNGLLTGSRAAVGSRRVTNFFNVGDQVRQGKLRIQVHDQSLIERLVGVDRMNRGQRHVALVVVGRPIAVRLRAAVDVA